MRSLTKVLLTSLIFIMAGFNASNSGDVTAGVPEYTEVTNIVANEITTESKTLLEFVNKREANVSWYGPGFHGRRTANGEVYDQEGFSAASRNLPFGTILKVTNLANGKSVIIRVNDRGPGSRRLELDLSKGAAREIGMIEQGVGRVIIEEVILSGNNVPIVSVN